MSFFWEFENKVGMAGDHNCNMFMDNIRVPKEFWAARLGTEAKLMRNNEIAARILTGALAAGNAQGPLKPF